MKDIHLDRIHPLPPQDGKYRVGATAWWYLSEAGAIASRWIILRADEPITPRNATTWLRETLAEMNQSIT